jgi:hypothetical protein
MYVASTIPKKKISSLDFKSVESGRLASRRPGEHQEKHGKTVVSFSYTTA